MDEDLVARGKRIVAGIAAVAMIGTGGGIGASQSAPIAPRRPDNEQLAEDSMNDFQEWGGEYMETHVLKDCYIADENIDPKPFYYVRWSDGELTRTDKHPSTLERHGRTVDKWHSRVERGVKSDWDKGGVGAGGFSFVDAMMAHADEAFRQAFEKWQRDEDLSPEEHHLMVNHRQFMKKQNLNARFQQVETTTNTENLQNCDHYWECEFVMESEPPKYQYVCRKCKARKVSK